MPWGAPKNSIIMDLDNQGFKQQRQFLFIIKWFENTVIFHIKTKKIKGKLHSTSPKQDEAFLQYTVGTDAKDT